MAIVAKDMRSDSRAKEVLPTMIFFALALVFVLSFALPPGAGRAPVPRPQAGAVGTREIAGTFLWISLLFAGVTGFGRSAASQRENGLMEGLLMAPLDPAGLFIAKATSNLLFLTLLEAAALPVFMVLLDIPAKVLFPQFLGVAMAANVALTAVGTLFGTASQYARARSFILPLITFPLLLPAVLAASRLTSSLLTTGEISGESRWFVLLVVYDVIFVTIGAVTFEFVVEE